MSMKQQLKQFIVENFYVSDPSEIRDDTLLVTTGVIDSTGMLEMLSLIHI